MRGILTILINVIFVSGIFGQEITIEGKVLDETEMGIPGATVSVVDEPGVGTATDIDGNFKLSGISPETELVVSAVGYKSYRFQPGDQREFTINMSTESVELEGIVVTGYGSVKKSDMTGSISSVQSKEIATLPVATVSEAMQGRAAGVQITQNSGAPGASATIRIRGVGTVNNSDPLFVVDGIIVNDIDYLNNDDIKNIEILKDASVAALYGARAANGVVVITTKSGREGDVKVNFGTQIGFQKYWKTLDLMDAYEYNVMRVIPVGGSIIKNTVESLEDGSFPILANNNWLDLISQTGVTQKYNLSFSGGSDKMSYYLGASRFDNKGIIKNTGFKRDNINADLSFNLTDNIKIRAKTIYSSAEQQRTPFSSNNFTIFRRAVSTRPDQQIRDTLGVVFDTPVSQVQFDRNESSEETLQNNFYLDIQLNDHFSFTSRAGLINTWDEDYVFNQINPTDEIAFSPNSTTLIRETYTNTFKWSWDNLLNYNREFGSHSISSTFAHTVEKFNFERIRAQNRSFLGNDPRIASLGSGFRGDNADGLAAVWTNLGFVARINYSYDSKYLAQFNFRADGSSRFRNDQWGYLPGLSLGWVISEEPFFQGNINDWMDFLKLRASWGRSGNNRISANNQILENYRSYTILQSGLSYGYGDESRFRVYDGFAPLGIANEAITWERTATYNIGLDFSFFEGMFDNSVEVYQRDTEGMLLDVPTVLSTGFQVPPTRNGGEIRNRGVDITTRFKTDINQVHLEISGNVSFVDNEVVSLGDDNQPVFGGSVNYDGLTQGPDLDFVTITQVGEPIGSFYGFVIDGIFQSQEEINEAGLVGQANPGDFRFKDLNQDGSINATDRTIIGSPIPDMTYGFSMAANWKGFDVRLFFQGEVGKQSFNTLNFNLLGFNGTNALSGLNQRFWNDGYFDDIESDELVDRLKEEYPVNMDTNIPRATEVDPQWRNYNRSSTFYVEDSDYLRLKNFQLGYTLPDRWLSRYKITNLRIFTSIQNAITWTSYGGLDPEIGPGQAGSNLANGIDYGQYPQPRTVTFGINVNFN